LDKPSLWIVAGCNGAGKSSFSKALFRGELIPFDYDKYFLHYYQSIQPSDIQDVMAHNLAFESLERQVNEAIVGRKDFCYEIEQGVKKNKENQIFDYARFHLTILKQIISR
jgi:predicted ABC-type ATPase